MINFKKDLPKAESKPIQHNLRCSQPTCPRPHLPGKSLCQNHYDLKRKYAERTKREKKAGIAPFLNDPSLLPKRPPGQ